MNPADIYPGGGTPPSTFPTTTSTVAHAVHHTAGTLPMTGADLLFALAIGAVIIAIALLMVGISNIGRPRT